MLKTATTSLLLFLCLFTSAQNWQMFNSHRQHFFEDSTGYFLINQFDSSEVAGNDTLLFPFRSLRDTLDGNSWDGSVCHYDAAGGSWLGNTVIIKSDGRNQFVNYNHDTLTFNTLAQPGDTLLAYQQSDGDLIVKMTVTEIKADTIFGVPDSVKTFELLAYDTLGNPLDTGLSNKTYTISKNHGVVSFYTFYQFPGHFDNALNNNFWFWHKYHSDSAYHYELAGNGDKDIGAYIATEADIFDFEIGESYHWQDYKSFGTWTSRVNHLVEILDLEETNDSIRYYINNYEVIKEHLSEFPGFDTLYFDENSLWTEWYSKNKKVMLRVPEQTDPVQAGEVYTMHRNDALCGQFIYRRHQIDAYVFIDFFDCIADPFEFGERNQQWITGRGMNEQYNHTVDDEYTSINYYYLKHVHNGDTVQCGSPYNGPMLSIRGNEYPELDLIAFPNPSSGNFTLDASSSLQENRLTIQQPDGRVISATENIQFPYQISLQDYPAGIYFVVVSTKGGRKSLRLQKL